MVSSCGLVELEAAWENFQIDEETGGMELELANVAVVMSLKLIYFKVIFQIYFRLKNLI